MRFVEHFVIVNCEPIVKQKKLIFLRKNDFVDTLSEN